MPSAPTTPGTVPQAEVRFDDDEPEIEAIVPPATAEVTFEPEEEPTTVRAGAVNHAEALAAVRAREMESEGVTEPAFTPPAAPPIPRELQTVVPGSAIENGRANGTPDGGIRLGVAVTTPPAEPPPPSAPASASRTSRRSPSRASRAGRPVADPTATIPPAQPTRGPAAPAGPPEDDTNGTDATEEGPPPLSGSGILARARSGAYGTRSTPHGSAGRIRPSGAPPRGGRAAPSGEVPRTSQQISPLGGSDVARPRRAEASLFGTPPAITSRQIPRRTSTFDPGDTDEAMVMEEDDDDAPTVLARLPGDGAKSGDAQLAATVAFVDDSEESEPAVVSPVGQPDTGRIPDQWLRDAVGKAEQLVRNFPVQAEIAYSVEPNLPFTLRINGATPAMSVRAMVNLVEFLAGIYTPPRARIELHQVAHLDKSFHRNVEAALEPYFANNVIVEAGPGRVDVRFTDPDPGWGQYPHLPLR